MIQLILVKSHIIFTISLLVFLARGGKVLLLHSTENYVYSDVQDAGMKRPFMPLTTALIYLFVCFIPFIFSDSKNSSLGWSKGVLNKSIIGTTIPKMPREAAKTFRWRYQALYQVVYILYFHIFKLNYSLFSSTVSTLITKWCTTFLSSEWTNCKLRFYKGLIDGLLSAIFTTVFTMIVCGFIFLIRLYYSCYQLFLCQCFH